MVTKLEERLLKTKNIGQKTITEVCYWAGIEVKQKPRFTSKAYIKRCIDLLRKNGYEIKTPEGKTLKSTGLLDICKKGKRSIIII